MKKFLSLVLALVMTMSLVTVSAGAKEFTDSDKLNYEEAVAVISEIKVVDGYADGKFNPQNTLTRQAAAKIICNLILGPTTASALSATTAPFKDVPVTSEFAGYIAYCAQQGIISGYADGEFKPGNTLTGYAFMKMLLGALGYESEIEGFVGANWSIQVAKKALAIGLNKGLVDTFNGTKAVNREEACLYALNTLKATMVEYDSKITANVNGAEIIVGASVAKDVKWNIASKTDGNIKDDDYVQFAEKYFPNLELDVVNGTYGRPSNKWLNKKSEIGTYASVEPTFVYTDAMEEKEVYADLGKNLIEYDWYAYVDGKEESKPVKPGKSVKADYVYTDAGTVTEIYVDNDAETVTLVEINYYLGEVTKVKSDDDGEYVTLNVMSGDAKLNDKKFYTEGFEEEQLVAFTRDMDDGDYVIGEVVELETTNGEVTRVENDTTTGHTYIRIAGEKNVYSEHTYYDVDGNGTKAHPTLNEDYILYLDPNGFVLGYKPAEESVDQYLFVLDTHNGLRDEATVLLATGEEVDIKIDDITLANGNAGTISDLDTWMTAANGGDSGLGTLCTYEVDSKGIYDLEIVASAISNSQLKDAKTSEIKSGKAYVDFAGSHNFIVDENTVFVDYDKGTFYTGYSEVPSVDDATLAYVLTGGTGKDAKVAEIVFILQGEVYDKDSTYFVLKDTKHESLKYDKKDYREYFNAYVGGEKKTMQVRYDALTVGGTATALSAGVIYQVNKTVDEEYITKVTAITSGTYYQLAVESVGSNAFWVSNVANKIYQFDVNSDTVFMVVDYKADGKIDSIYEGKLKNMDDDDYTVQVTVLKEDDNTAELVVLERTPVVVVDPKVSKVEIDTVTVKTYATPEEAFENPIEKQVNVDYAFKVTGTGSLERKYAHGVTDPSNFSWGGTSGAVNGNGKTDTVGSISIYEITSTVNGETDTVYVAVKGVDMVEITFTVTNCRVEYNGKAVKDNDKVMVAVGEEIVLNVDAPTGTVVTVTYNGNPVPGYDSGKYYVTPASGATTLSVVAAPSTPTP